MKPNFQRRYASRCFCSSYCHDKSYKFSCEKCPISHDRRRKCYHQHKKCMLKPTNFSKCSKEYKDEQIDVFDFTGLPSLLQERFIELATPYEKSKLQFVNEQFFDKIQPKISFEVLENLIIYKTPEIPFKHGGIYGNGVYLNPLDDSHIEKLHDLLINYELVGIDVPDGWIEKAVKQNVTFYLETVRMECCNLSNYEIQEICEFGALKYLYLHKIIATSPISMKSMAAWLKNATRIWIDIKNMEFEYDWPMAFLEDYAKAAKFDRITLKNLSFSFDVFAFDRLLKERVIQCKYDAEWLDKEKLTPSKFFAFEELQIDCIIFLSFNEEEVKGLSKKSVIKKFNKLFAGFYKNVSKAEFECCHNLNEKFIVEHPGGAVKSKYPYPPRAKRFDRYFYISCNPASDEMDFASAAANEKMKTLQIF